MVDMFRQYYGGNITDDVMKKLNFKQQAYDNLINRAILRHLADKLKISVTDQEVMQSILSYPAFQRDGAFSQQVYQFVLKQNKISAEDFEAMQKNSLLAEKLRGIISEGAEISTAEVHDVYRVQNERINLQFLKIISADYRKKVKLTDADLEKFLKDNAEKFRVPEKVQVKYVIFTGLNVPVSISEDEINNYYSLYSKKFAKGNKTPPLTEIRQQIISDLRSIKARDAAAKEAKKSYETIYQENNFEDYARKNGLKEYNTDLFTKESIPSEIKGVKDIDQVFSLKKDETTPPLASEKGFYIFKATAQKPSYIPSLADAKAEIEKSYIDSEALKISKTDVENILSSLKKGEDFRKTASEKGLKISDTGPFVPGATIPTVGESKDLSNALYQLSDKNPYPDNVYTINSAQFIVRFKNRENADEQGFETRKDSLKAGLLRLKENEIFQSWLQDTKKEMKNSGKFKINKEASDL